MMRLEPSHLMRLKSQSDKSGGHNWDWQRPTADAKGANEH